MLKGLTIHNKVLVMIYCKHHWNIEVVQLLINSMAQMIVERERDSWFYFKHFGLWGLS